MGRGTKIASIIVILLMVSVPLACLTVEADGDEGTVTIAVDKPYEYNRSNLDKIGVSEDCYRFDRSSGCYVMTLNGISYSTSVDVALRLVAEGTPRFVIELKGINAVVGGCYGILALCDTHNFELNIRGNGMLTAVGGDASSNESVGIKVDGTLRISGAAHIFAAAGNVKVDSPGFETEDNVSATSMGIMARAVGIMAVGDDFPIVHAQGGNVAFNAMGKCTAKHLYLESAGITTFKLFVKGSNVIAEGGDVSWDEQHVGYCVKLTESLSSGVMLMDPKKAGDKQMVNETVIVDSKMIGYAGDTVGMRMSQSVGMLFRAQDNEKVVTVKDSILVGYGGDSRATSKEAEVMPVSDGVDMYGKTMIVSTLIHAESGHCNATGEGDSLVTGLYVNGETTISESIIVARANDPHASASRGIDCLNGNLTIKDSEIYASGGEAAIMVMTLEGYKLDVSKGYRSCNSIALDGTKTALTDASKPEFITYRRGSLLRATKKRNNIFRTERHHHLL